MITVSAKGTLPEFLALDIVTDRAKLEYHAAVLFDRKPNIVGKCESDGRAVVVKLFGWRNPAHYYLLPFIQSRAQVSRTIAQLLLKAGTRTPKPLFVYTKRKWGFIQTNVFITEFIPAAETLRAYLKTEYPLAEAQRIMEDLAVNIARMHGQGIFHRDLTIGNILIDEDRKTYLIDLNRAKIRKPTHHRRLKDLAKIYFGPFTNSHTVALRKTFFMMYKKESEIDIRWEERYANYRTRLANYKQRRKRIKSVFRNKQTNTVGV